MDDLVNQVDRLSGAFDEIISGRNITPEEKAMLISLRNMVLVEVKKVIANRFQTNQEAVEFLVAFRDSVNNTIIAMTLLK